MKYRGEVSLTAGGVDEIVVIGGGGFVGEGGEIRAMGGEETRGNPEEKR